MSGEGFAGIRRASLHEHGPTLGRSRQIERSGDLEDLAFVVDLTHALLPQKRPGRAIVDDGVVAPAVPKCRHDAHELLALVVAVGVCEAAATEVAAACDAEGGDNVPTDAPTTDVVE